MKFSTEFCEVRMGSFRDAVGTDIYGSLSNINVKSPDKPP